MFITDICDVSNFSELKHSFPSVGKEKENVRTYKAEAAYKVIGLTKNFPKDTKATGDICWRRGLICWSASWVRRTSCTASVSPTLVICLPENQPCFCK